MTLARLELIHFKAFSKYSIRFPSTAILIGPNNAGKSTIVSAIRSVALMLRHAQSRTADLWDDAPNGESLWVHWMELEDFAIGAENLRHEFHERETRLVADFANPELRLTAVWPTDMDGGYFFLSRSDGWQPSRPKELRNNTPSIGVLPVLTPIEYHEALLDENYVRKSFWGAVVQSTFPQSTAQRS